MNAEGEKFNVKRTTVMLPTAACADCAAEKEQRRNKKKWQEIATCPTHGDVPPNYTFSTRARGLLIQAWERQGYVVVREWAPRDWHGVLHETASIRSGDFAAALDLAACGLLRNLVDAHINGERSITYGLTPRGREVARIVGAS